MTVMDERFAVGQVFKASPMRMTRERMRWYCDALDTSTSLSGKFVISELNIHNDDAYAHGQGLPGIIADGMISTNYISSLLYSVFGLDYLARGELATKYIRPVYEDDILETHAVVTGVVGGMLTLEVWCQTGDGQKVTVGTAAVPQAAGKPA